MSLDIPDWSDGDHALGTREVMLRAAEENRPFGLATILNSDAGQHPDGVQMMVTLDARYGALLGGFVDDDVARHALTAIGTGKTVRRVYDLDDQVVQPGLSRGGWIEVQIERVEPNDRVLRDIEHFTALRQQFIWTSDGERRTCTPTDDYALLPTETGMAQVIVEPCQRLVIVGHNPLTMAIARLGAELKWEVEVIEQKGKPPSTLIPGVSTVNSTADRFFQACPPDPWTAILVTSRNRDFEIEALKPALLSSAGYVGVISSQMQPAERQERLMASGVRVSASKRIRAFAALDPKVQTELDLGRDITDDIVAMGHKEHRLLGHGTPLAIRRNRRSSS